MERALLWRRLDRRKSNDIGNLPGRETIRFRLPCSSDRLRGANSAFGSRRALFLRTIGRGARSLLRSFDRAKMTLFPLKRSSPRERIPSLAVDPVPHGAFQRAMIVQLRPRKGFSLRCVRQMRTAPILGQIREIVWPRRSRERSGFSSQQPPWEALCRARALMPIAPRRRVGHN